MPYSMWIYVPQADDQLDKVNGKSEVVCDNTKDQTPNLKSDLENIIKSINSISKGEKEEKDDDNNDNNNNNAYNMEWKERLVSFHEPLWEEIIAWSCDLTDRDGVAVAMPMSLTKWASFGSQYMMYLIAKRIVVPQVLFRVCKVEKGSLYIHEFMFTNARFLRISLGGSGGSDRFTENITITGEKIFVNRSQHSLLNGEIEQSSEFLWDNEKHQSAYKGAGQRSDSLKSPDSSVQHSERNIKIGLKGGKVLKTVTIPKFTTLVDLKKICEESSGKPVKNLFVVLAREKEEEDSYESYWDRERKQMKWFVNGKIVKVEDLRSAIALQKDNISKEIDSDESVRKIASGSIILAE